MQGTFFLSTLVLKLLKTAEGIRKLLDTVAEALPQVSGTFTSELSSTRSPGNPAFKAPRFCCVVKCKMTRV